MRSSSKAALYEEQLTQQIASAGIRLRCDKVALRLLESVKAGVAHTVPADHTVAFTVTAPIRHPGKTSAALQQWLRTGETSTTIYGNIVRARTIHRTAGDAPRVLGFVHNPDGHADLALDIAGRVLGKQ